MSQTDADEFAPSKRQERRSQEVWNHNLEEEIVKMRDVAEMYQHVAMDTQFPGIVARPTGPFSDYALYNYQALKCNIDLTRLLQVGMTFSDAKGNRPKGISTWRFNFAFNASKDLFSQPSIDGLRNTRGLDLAKHHTQGIEPQQFGELLMHSGLVLEPDVRWIAFCGADSFNDRPEDAASRAGEPSWVTYCGMYDFAGLLRLLTSQPLPDEVSAFYELLDTYFPSRCDMAKHLHRLPQLAAEGGERRRNFFRNAHHTLEAFFRLPDAVRRTAFDKVEEEPPAAAGSSSPRRTARRIRDREEGRHKSRKNGSASNGTGAAGATAIVANGSLGAGAAGPVPPGPPLVAAATSSGYPGPLPPAAQRLPVKAAPFEGGASR